MASIESLKKRIHTTEDLQSVVKSMRVLAALNLRQYGTNGTVSISVPSDY